MSTTPTSSLSSPGLGSGLDINGIISKLMQVESQPLTALDTREASFQAQLSAYGQLKSAVSTFQGAMDAAANLSKYQSLSVNVGDTSILTATAGSGASIGNHSISVTQLAQAQTLISSGYTDAAAVVGTGTLTFEFGTFDGSAFTVNSAQPAKTVTIGSGQNTLAGIRDAINNANIGVTASIVNDGSTQGNHLVITSNSTGASNSLRISASNDSDANNTDAAGLSALAYDPTAAAGNGKNMSQTVTAQDAKINLDGITVSKASNTITDALQGVTLTLLKPGSSTTVNLARDTAGATNAVNAFVKAYNNLNSAINGLTAYDATNKKSSPLTGDITAYNIQTAVRSTLGSTLKGLGGAYTLLSQIGVSFQKDGTLSVDSTQLSTAMSQNFNAIAGLFADVGTSNNTQVQYQAAGANTLPGMYAVQVSRVATQAAITGSAPTLPYASVMTGAQVGNSLTFSTSQSFALTVDGTLGSTMTISPGTYDSTALATQMQQMINGDTTLAGKAVTVTYSGGHFVISSNNSSSGSVLVTTPNSTLGLKNSYALDSSNNTLAVNVDSVTSGTIALTPGTYADENAIAAEMQTKINGDRALVAAGASVNVSYTGGHFVITSNRYGSGSKVSITTGNSTLGLTDTTTVSQGVDVAGSINGVAAIGAGQTLTGTRGDASDGMTIQVTGTTLPTNTVINYSQGYAAKLSALASTFLDSTGPIQSHTDGINATIKDIGTQRDELNARLAIIQQNYQTQYNALDAMISQMNSTSSYLTQQLANLPKMS